MVSIIYIFQFQEFFILEKIQKWYSTRVSMINFFVMLPTEPQKRPFLKFVFNDKSSIMMVLTTFNRLPFPINMDVI